MTKYSEHMNTVKAKPTDRAKEIKNLKAKLDTLSTQLDKEKKINKPLLRDVKNLIYSNTKLPKLESTYAKLQEISSSQEAKKKLTKKEFKVIKDDTKTKFLVYRTYHIIKQTTDKEGNIVHKEEDSHITDYVRGKQNIKKQIKKDIQYFFTYGYVDDVKVTKVIINRHEELTPQTYRYKQAAFPKIPAPLEKYVKEKYDDSPGTSVIWDKAWQMQFEYRNGLNFDNNDEYEWKCVPNALYKMYGDKSNGRDKFIKVVADGGIEYIESQLNDLGDDGLDFGIEEEYNNGIKGYSPLEILLFCNKHKIRCFGYDWKMEQFITNKAYDINFHKSLPAFVFYFNDNHIYLINDKNVRHGLLQCNSNIKSMLSIEKKSKVVETKNYVDVEFDKWNDIEDKSNIYITSPNVVHKLFYKEICNGIVHNNKIKMSEKEGVVRFKYNNKMIIYNPDYHHVIKTLERLDDSYIFKNQRIHTLAREYCDKEFGGIPQSTMNKRGDDVFHSEFIRNAAFNGWIKAPTSANNLHAFDYNKHYTSCFMGLGLKFGWPIYNVFDEVKPFDGEIKTGFYYIETTNYLPFRGNGWYDADLVYYALEQNIIKTKDIIYEYKSSNELKPKHFKKFVNSVYEKFENPKLAINAMIGLFGHDYVNTNTHHFTTNSKYAFLETAANPDFKMKYVYHHEFNYTESPEQSCICIDDMDVNKYISDEKPLCYHLFNMKRNQKPYNELPFHYKIYNVSAMKMHQMAKQIGGSVVAIYTDTLIFEGNINKPECNKTVIGGIREAELKEYPGHLNVYVRPDKFKLPEKQVLKQIDEYKLEGNKGVFITGMAGTGKSYTCNELKKQLETNEYCVCTPTHKSSLIVGGSTVYNLFNISPQDHTYVKSTVNKLKESGIKYIFIDEVSMIPSKVWGVLNDIKRVYNFTFILIGDFNQLDPVETKIYNVLESEVFSRLVDGQMLKLTRNYRAENDPEFETFIQDQTKVLNDEKINFKNYGKKDCRKSLCWTNKMRKAVNDEWMLKESKNNKFITVNNIRVFVGLPVISNKTKTINDMEIKNNEEFNVIDFDNQTITVNSTIRNIDIVIGHDDFKTFDLAYCITVHKAQGSTYNFAYSIYEYFMFDKKLLYTALSRSTEKKFVNFVNKSFPTVQGYVYKIENKKTNKVYVGSTTTSLKQRFKEHTECKDTSPLHKDMRKYGSENFEIGLLKKVEYSDIETLLIAEACMMIEYGSIENGYNTKLSCDLTNLF
jgi:hypothetical protein